MADRPTAVCCCADQPEQQCEGSKPRQASAAPAHAVEPGSDHAAQATSTPQARQALQAWRAGASKSTVRAGASWQARVQAQGHAGCRASSQHSLPGQVMSQARSASKLQATDALCCVSNPARACHALQGTSCHVHATAAAIAAAPCPLRCTQLSRGQLAPCLPAASGCVTSPGSAALGGAGLHIAGARLTCLTGHPWGCSACFNA